MSIEHIGIPILPAIPQAIQALQEMGMHRKVQLIVSGGIHTGARSTDHETCNLDPENLVALNVEAAAMVRFPLAGTNWISGQVQY